MARCDPTAERLRELLHYDPETGIFTWRVTRNNFTKAGRIAGNLNSQGYIHIVVDKTQCKAHRLAWLYMTGAMPSKTIDHINHDRSDNRFTNLRDVDTATNCINKAGARKGNPTGVLGVIYCKREKRFIAKVWRNHRAVFFRSFKTLEEAAAARKEEEIRLGIRPSSSPPKVV